MTKLDSQGAVVFTTYVGTSGNLSPGAMTLDDVNNIYLAGTADGGNFPGPIGGGRTFSTDLGVTHYAFAARLSADGTRLDFFSRVGGLYCAPGSPSCFQGGTSGNAVAVDASKNVWIAPTTGSNRLPFTKSMFPAADSGNGPNFVVKLSADGNSMLLGTYLDGVTPGTQNLGSLAASGIRVDSVGSAYIAGSTDKLDFPTTAGAFQTAPRSNMVPNAFVTKINDTKDTTTTVTGPCRRQRHDDVHDHRQGTDRNGDLLRSGHRAGNRTGERDDCAVRLCVCGWNARAHGRLRRGPE